MQSIKLPAICGMLTDGVFGSMKLGGGRCESARVELPASWRGG